MRKRLIISGRVQGVFFRASTEKEAGKFPDLCGYVKNLETSQVEAVFQGSEQDVSQMVQWCHQGPESARVDAVEVFDEEDVNDEPLFRILR